MQQVNPPAVVPRPHQPNPAPDALISELVGQVFESAPAGERSQLLRHLIRPLGVLSLVGIANGIFAKLRFRGGWSDCLINVDDIRSVHADDVVVLVNHVQQISVEAVDGLAQLLMRSPALVGSAAAVLLISLLLERASARRMGRVPGGMTHGMGPARPS